MRALLGRPLALLDHFDSTRAVVLRQSLGGMVDLRPAMQHPDHVRTVVACEAAGQVIAPPTANNMPR